MNKWLAFSIGMLLAILGFVAMFLPLIPGLPLQVLAFLVFIIFLHRHIRLMMVGIGFQVVVFIGFIVYAAAIQGG